MVRRCALLTCGGCALFVLLAAASPAVAGWYTNSLADSVVVPIRGETADTAALGDDRYVEDNLDFLLSQHEWLIVNFSSYWCPDSDNFAPGYYETAHSDACPGLRWAYAEVDGTNGNENFRTRFELPGVPTVILFHNGVIAADANGTPAILDGHEGDKTVDDLLIFVATFYQPTDTDTPATDDE
ncbi:MAG TPA: protein disulfide isomerase family protein [Acidobacteriota bacterium]|nr:protein disulfide isomerase family protein [Acidobacteriota bacterium]